MATSIQDFLLRFKTAGVADINKASNAVKALSDDVAAFGNQSGAFGNSISAIIGKLGPMGSAAAVAGGAFVALGMKAINMADDLADISDATGVSASALNNLSNSLITAGGKAEDFATLATRLNKNVGEAASGNEGLQKSFKTLGVFVTDANGNLRNSGDVLRDVIARLAGIEDPATRAKLAVEFFGKEAAKLDFTKLNAANDPFKDAQIQQLAKYRDAIDAISNSASNSLLAVFGKLAIAIDEASKRADEAEKKANAQGQTFKNVPVTPGPGRPLTGLGQSRNMTAQEKAAFDEQQRLAEQARLMAPARGSTRADTSQGGFGAAGPSLTASNKAIVTAQIESERYAALAGQDARTAAALKGANDRMGIDIKSANDIKNLQINLAQDIKKITAEVRANDKIEAGQQDAEIGAKTRELQGKVALEVQKIREKAAKDATDFQIKQNARIFSEEEAQRQATADAIAAQEKSFADATKNAYNQVEAFKEVTGQLQDQILLEDTIRQLSEVQASMYRKIADETRRRTDALKALEKTENLSHEERKRRDQEIRDNSALAIQAIRDQAAVETERQQSFSDGYSQAFKKYAEDAKNVSKQAGDYFNIFARGFENVFANMTKGFPGIKAAFKDLVNNMIAEFLRLQAQKAFVSLFGGATGGGLLGGLFGGLFGGGASSMAGAAVLGLPGFANGGSISANQLAMVGERGPELFLPRTAGTVIPNNMLGGGNVTTVNYNIQAVDASSFRSLVARDPEFIYSVTEAGRRSQPTRRLA
jgi:lambda family phage tail tape measure protein